MSTITTATPIAALMDTDSYKLDHRRMYGEGVTRVYSNWTNRSSRIEGVDHVVHFGLQAFLQRYCIDKFAPFFAADEDEVARLYKEDVESVVGPNAIGEDHIRELHRLGYLPLRFSAVPEGTLVPIGVPTFTIENTVDEFFWLVNYIETALSSSYWLPSTSATLALRYRTLLEAAARRTGGDVAAVDFQLHDFSFRGLSSPESAAASGAGHLLSFKGSDSLGTIDYVRRYYKGDNGVILQSVPATEHSVMTAGTPERGDETEMFRSIIALYPSGIVSVVSDTYDLWAVLTKVLPTLHEQIVARDGKLVIRPDSGDPADILCGTAIQKNLPADKGVVELLWEEFGGTVNEQGYKVLDPHIGAIYGDSITLERARDIVERLAAKGFASTNVVFGVGSFTYQFVTRDTFGSAIKATWVLRAGKGHPMRKDPVTDNGGKRSARGRLAVLTDDRGELTLHENVDAETETRSLLQPVWEDGEFIQYQSLADVRSRLADQAVRLAERSEAVAV